VHWGIETLGFWNGEGRLKPFILFKKSFVGGGVAELGGIQVLEPNPFFVIYKPGW